MKDKGSMRRVAKMARAASQPVARQWGIALAMGVALIALLCAGCASGVGAQASASPTATIAPPVTPTPIPPRPTATSSAPCASITSDPGMPTTVNIPLPPGTVTKILSGAAGAGFSLECTPGATQASITSYLNTALAAQGWRKWDPRTNDAHGCGTEPNDIWQWYNSQEAVGWGFNGPAYPAMPSLPEWMLMACSLAYGA